MPCMSVSAWRGRRMSHPLAPDGPREGSEARDDKISGSSVGCTDQVHGMGVATKRDLSASSASDPGEDDRVIQHGVEDDAGDGDRAEAFYPGLVPGAHA